MMSSLEKIWVYITQHQFVQHAIIVCVLIALCSSLIGSTLVLKRFSFIGDGLSHVAFGTLAVATAFGAVSSTPVVMVVTVICAIVLLQIGKNTRIRGDAAIAMLSVGALAVGYLAMNLLPGSSNVAGDVCSSLFGSTSMLTIFSGEMWMCVGMSALVIAVFVFFYNKIFAVTFDEEFASATGTKVGFYNAVISVIIAVIIVLAMELVGSLLVSALVIFPALSAMRMFKNFRSVIICSAVISVLCALVGIVVSILAETPVGSTIVVANIAAFLVCCLIGLISRRTVKQ